METGRNDEDLPIQSQQIFELLEVDLAKPTTGSCSNSPAARGLPRALRAADRGLARAP
jgi:hypothetical protein